MPARVKERSVFGNELTKWYRALVFDSEEEYALLIANLSSSDHARNAFAMNNRGVARAEIGLLDEALDDFRAACELAPGASVPHMNHGDLLATLERDEEALAEYTAAISLEPADAYYRRSRAHLLHRLGRYDAAIADYDEAIRVQPDFRRTYDDREKARSRDPLGDA
jgi:tetratricopeptide (TPR) repeat protein